MPWRKQYIRSEESSKWVFTIRRRFWSDANRPVVFGFAPCLVLLCRGSRHARLPHGNRKERILGIQERGGWLKQNSVLLYTLILVYTLPVLCKAVPESSYTLTNLPFQTITESYRWNNQVMIELLSASATYLKKNVEVWHLCSYLGNTNSFDVHIRLESEVHPCAKVSDAELCWGELHCCHLLAEVGGHQMLAED